MGIRTSRRRRGRAAEIGRCRHSDTTRRTEYGRALPHPRGLPQHRQTDPRLVRSLERESRGQEIHNTQFGLLNDVPREMLHPDVSAKVRHLSGSVIRHEMPSQRGRCSAEAERHWSPRATWGGCWSVTNVIICASLTLANRDKGA